MDWNILRDQIWDFIGVIVALFTLIITLIITFFQKHKKELTYDLLSKTSLISTQEKIKGKLKIIYNGEEVEDVKLIEIRVTNSGSIAIPSQDYERPLKFTISNKSRILSVEIIKCIPENLIIDFVSNEKEIVFNPVLLNSKDSFIFKAIISKLGSENLNVDGRIRDIKEVRKGKDGSGYHIWVVVGFIFSISGLYQLFTLEKSIPKQEIPWTNEKTIGIALFVIGYLIIGVTIANTKRMKQLLNRIRTDKKLDL